MKWGVYILLVDIVDVGMIRVIFFHCIKRNNKIRE